MGTHLRVLSESFPMNTNMTGFRSFSIFFAKVASALEGLPQRQESLHKSYMATNPYAGGG